MGESTSYDQFRESIGTISIGIVVAIIIVLFLMRMHDWTITALESLLALVFGLGVLKAFKFTDEQNAFFYPVGLLGGIILCAVTLISPYGEILIRWTSVQTNTTVIHTQTVTVAPTTITTAVQTTSLTGIPTPATTVAATGTMVHTTFPTAVATTAPLTPVTPTPAMTASQAITPAAISILVIVFVIAFLIAYWVEKRKREK
jgi:hypothetical protein